MFLCQHEHRGRFSNLHECTFNQTNSAPDLSLQQRFNNLRGTSNPSPPPFFANNSPNFHVPAQTSSFNRNFSSSNNNSQPPVNNLFGSQTATLTREIENEKKRKKWYPSYFDDALYKLLENPNLELGDGLVENLGTTAEDIFQVDNITKEEEEDVVLEKIKEEYGFEDFKETFDKGKVPENIYFFYGGDSENFYRALEFVGLSPMNR